MDYIKLQDINTRLMNASHPFQQGGKIYVEVAKRVQGFWALFPEGRILTHWMDLTDEHAVCIAEVYDGETLLATGTAREDKNAGYVNKTSFVENAETSAVGRALGILGIGSVDAIASEDETRNANQATKTAEKAAKKEPAKPKTIRAQFVEICDVYGLNKKQMAFDFGLTNTSTDADFAQAIESIKSLMAGA